MTNFIVRRFGIQLIIDTTHLKIYATPLVGRQETKIRCQLKLIKFEMRIYICLQIVDANLKYALLVL